MELPCPSEFLSGSASIRMGWMLPSSPWPSGWSPGSSRNRIPETPCSISGLLSRACALLQSPPSLEWPPLLSHEAKSDAAPPLRFSSPSAFPHPEQRPRWPGLPHPTACTFRFSRPLGALVRTEPAGLVSCQIRSWGCALQSFAPLSQPYVVSDAAPPVTLGSAPYPSGPCKATAETVPLRTPYRRVGTRPRLRGLAPREDPPLVPGGLDRLERVALLGFCPPGCSPPSERPESRPPLTCLARRTRTAEPATPQGVHSEGIGWSLARLPTLLGFCAS
jgi:hypothetical protein